MNILNIDSEITKLWYEEERVLASFTRRLVEIAAGAGTRGSNLTPTAVLNLMSLPAVAIDGNGFVVDVTAATGAVFDNDIKVKDNRIVVRDLVARALLDEAIEQLKTPRQIPLAVRPFIVRRRDKLPVMIRIWPFAVQSCLSLCRPASPMHAILSVFPIFDAYGQFRDYM